MARIDRVLETSLYVADLARSGTFYRDVLSLKLLLETRRLIAFDAGGGCVLLLFPRDADNLPCAQTAVLNPGRRLGGESQTRTRTASGHHNA
jgi:catechol-2,3-dioxygenase